MPTTPGTRTSATAIRTGTTRTTSSRPSSSAQSTSPDHAALLYRLLHQAYYDCRRRKRNTHSSLAFEVRLATNLWDLCEELLAGTYRPGRSICFVAKHPKPREIWAAAFRDRVVQQLWYNAIGHLFERSFTADSCASIPGRGTLYAGLRLNRHARSITQNWTLPAYYLKCDLANFFVSIDKRVLWELLVARIQDPFWLDLTGRILWHDCRDDFEFHGRPSDLNLVPRHKRLTEQPSHRGLPIGNLSSQVMANIILNLLDQRMKHHYRVRYYVRYVDDFIVLGHSPQWLNSILADVTTWLPERLHLDLNTKKTILQPVDRGMDFVGHFLKPHCHRMRPRTVRCSLHRLGKLKDKDLFVTVNSYFGHLRQAPKSHRDRCVLGRAVRRRGRMVDGSMTKSYRPRETAC